MEYLFKQALEPDTLSTDTISASIFPSPGQATRLFALVFFNISAITYRFVYNYSDIDALEPREL